MACIFSRIAMCCVPPIEDIMLEGELRCPPSDPEAGLAARRAARDILTHKTEDSFSEAEAVVVYNSFAHKNIHDLRRFPELQKELMALVLKDKDQEKARNAFLTLTGVYTPSVLEPMKRTGLPAMCCYRPPEVAAEGVERLKRSELSAHDAAIKDFIAREIAEKVRSTPSEGEEFSEAEVSRALAASTPFLSLYLAQHPSRHKDSTPSLGAVLGGTIAAIPGYRRDNTREIMEVLDDIYRDSHQFPFIRTLLDYTTLEAASGRLKIYATPDPNLARVRVEDAGCGGLCLGSREIYFATGDDAPSGIGILAHEATHHAIHKIYGSFTPARTDQERTELAAVIQEAKDAMRVLKRLKREGKSKDITDALSRMFSLFNTKYYAQDNTTYGIELPPRIPQIIINYGEEGLKALSDYFPKLLQYWDKHIAPKIQEQIRAQTRTDGAEENILLRQARGQARSHEGSPAIRIPEVVTAAHTPPSPDRASEASARSIAASGAGHASPPAAAERASTGAATASAASAAAAGAILGAASAASRTPAQAAATTPAHISHSLSASGYFYRLGGSPQAAYVVAECLKTPQLLEKLSKRKLLTPDNVHMLAECMEVPHAVEHLLATNAIDLITKRYASTKQVLELFRTEPTKLRALAQPKIINLMKNKGAELSVLSSIHTTFPDNFTEYAEALAPRRRQVTLRSLDISTSDYADLRGSSAEFLARALDEVSRLTADRAKEVFNERIAPVAAISAAATGEDEESPIVIRVSRRSRQTDFSHISLPGSTEEWEAVSLSSLELTTSASPSEGVLPPALLGRPPQDDLEDNHGSTVLLAPRRGEGIIPPPPPGRPSQAVIEANRRHSAFQGRIVVSGDSAPSSVVDKCMASQTSARVISRG